MWRSKTRKGRGLLAGAIALFLLGVGGGTYWMLGQPYLAWRAAQGVQTRDVNGLIALLIKRVRAGAETICRPGSIWGAAIWRAGDAGDAAKAYARAVALADAAAIPMPAWIRSMAKRWWPQANGAVGDEARSRLPRRAEARSQGTGGALLPGPGAGGAWRQAGRAGLVERPAGRSAGQLAAASDAGGPHRAADRADRRRRARSQAMVASWRRG